MPPPPRHMLLVATHCWSCDAVLQKPVARAARAHRHLSWFCGDCEVGWNGPGQVA